MGEKIKGKSSSRWRSGWEATQHIQVVPDFSFSKFQSKRTERKSLERKNQITTLDPPPFFTAHFLTYFSCHGNNQTWTTTKTRISFLILYFYLFAIHKEWRSGDDSFHFFSISKIKVFFLEMKMTKKWNKNKPKKTMIHFTGTTKKR